MNISTVAQRLVDQEVQQERPEVEVVRQIVIKQKRDKRNRIHEVQQERPEVEVVRQIVKQKRDKRNRESGFSKNHEKDGTSLSFLANWMPNWW